MNTQEMIETIRSNYPPENYSELREALDHCLTLLEAAAEGRLLVLPCKVGDTVFYNDTYGNVYEAIVQSIVIDKSRTIFITSGIGFDETTVGKTVFLTSEEAEAAMRRGADG